MSALAIDAQRLTGLLHESVAYWQAKPAALSGRVREEGIDDTLGHESRHLSQAPFNALSMACSSRSASTGLKSTGTPDSLTL